MKELIKNSNEIPFEREVLSKRTEKPEKTIPCKISDRERLSKDEITLERRTVYLEKKAAYGMEQESTYGSRTDDQDNHGTASFIRKPDVPGKTGGIIRSKTENRMRGIVRNSFRYMDANGREGEQRGQNSPILEDVAFSAMNQGELEDRTSKGAAKHTYRLAKHSVAAGRYALKKHAADRKQLIKDMRTGTLSRSQTAQKIRSLAAKNIREAGQSIGTTLQQDISQTVEEFDGSDDLGIQAVVKTKDTYFSTKAGIHGIWKAKKMLLPCNIHYNQRPRPCRTALVQSDESFPILRS